MERENNKVSIVYILTGIILLLIIYLVLFVYKSLNSEEPENENYTPDSSMPEVASSCTFDMTMSEFNNIQSNTEICGAVNRINLTDVVINGQTLDTVIYYSNIDAEDTGIYINNAKIADTASNTTTHQFTIIDNLLFMTTVDANSANFEVYDENVNVIYSLADTLNSEQIVDTTFASLANTNPNINTVLSTNYIDASSFNFTSGQIIFNSTSKTTCTPGSYSGSSYMISYNGTVFESPVYISSIPCQ